MGKLGTVLIFKRKMLANLLSGIGKKNSIGRVTGAY